MEANVEFKITTGVFNFSKRLYENIRISIFPANTTTCAAGVFTSLAKFCHFETMNIGRYGMLF